MSSPSDRHPAQWLVDLLMERGNVGFVCEKHASKPGGFVGREPASFLGHYVKLCFPRMAGGTENMWVKVERLEGEELIGSLENEPTTQLAMGDFHKGDLFAFVVAEIAAALPITSDETDSTKPSAPA